MRPTLSLLILLSASTLIEARDNPSGPERARLEIQSLLGRMSEAERVNDAPALAQLYESDGMLLPSSGQPVKGREEITKRYQAIFAGKAPRFTLESEELWVMEDVAVSRGVSRGPSTRRNVKGPIKNRFVMTLKRHGDSWEIHSLVWNPATPPMPRGRD